MKKLFILLTILFFATTLNAHAISNEAVLQYNQGIDYYKVGQYDNAIAAFRAAIKLDPSYIDAYYNLGTVLESLHQYDAALAVFKQVIVRKPDDYDSVYKAAWLSYKLGEDQKARIYLSIIPSNCSRTKDAQALAAEMNFNLIPMQTPTTTTTNSTTTVVTKKPSIPAAAAPAQPKKTVNQTSGIYQNIPAPTGVTSDKSGNVYIAEFNNNAIIQIAPDNKKIVFLKDPKISGPIGLAFDKFQNMYIANYNKDNVLKVSKNGQITVLINNVKKPYYLYIDGCILFISCQGSNSVLRYKITN